MAFALDALGKSVRLVNADSAPEHYQEFPGMDRIEIAAEVSAPDVDALIVMECSDLSRTGVERTRGSVHHQHRPSSRQSDVRLG